MRKWGLIIITNIELVVPKYLYKLSIAEMVTPEIPAKQNGISSRHVPNRAYNVK